MPAEAAITCAPSTAAAAAGACVVLTDINVELGEKFAKSIGDRAPFVEHDVSSLDAWQRVIQESERHFGRVSIRVNNAGIAWFEGLENSSESAARRMI